MNENERIEGDVTGELDVLSLGMEDDDILRAVGRVKTSEAFWNSKLDLDAKRDKADNFYLDNNAVNLYEYQTPYKDNRIFTAIETLVSLVSSKPPQPLVVQAYDTEASYELSQQLQKTLLAKYEDLYLKREFQMVARHILAGYRIGVMKYRHDDTVGALQEDGTRFGDISIKALRAQRIVIDAGAQDINDIPLIGEYRASILEDLLDLYPDKRDAILQEAGVSAGTAIPMTKRIGYMEVHFTTKDKATKERIEAITWTYGKVVLDSTKSPFWNYENPQDNFLVKPQKPYVLFNFLNLGRWVIDDTSLMDQAQTLQEVHDKRGRQIVENADQGNGGWVFNTMMVDAEDAANWVNNPGDKILAKGNVREAAARFPAPDLPDYVLQDKIDARNEIDNIYGTHGAIKGEITNSKTLGQDVMSQRGDSARLNTLATCIEDGADRLYKAMTQYFKVFYNVPQLIRFDSELDSTSFFSFGSAQIEPGVAVRVKSGSVLPEDPQTKKQDTLAMLPILDPLNIAKGLGVSDPKQWAKENVMYKLFPDKYVTEILGYTPGDQGTQDPQALQDIQAISKGEPVQPSQQSVTKEYMATYQAFIQSPQFKQLPPEIQQMHIAHIKQVLGMGKQAMGAQGEKPGLPPNSGTPPQLGSGTPEMTNGGQSDMMTLQQ